MYQERLRYQGDLTSIIKNICFAYDVGELVSFSLIETGYEDYNVKIETDVGKYVAKIFSKTREPNEIIRYVSIMEKVIVNGILHPKLYKSRDGYLFSDSGLDMVLMDYIQGNTFFDTDTSPNKTQLKQIIGEIVKINRIKFNNLSVLSDSWAVQNLHNIYTEVVPILNNKLELDFVKNTIRKFDLIPLDKLPTVFVHGDITKQNVICAPDGKCFLLDFSVANIYPRIQDLAVVVANLLVGNGMSVTQNAIEVLSLYLELETLSDIEQKYFIDYVWAAVAMVFMGSLRQKYIRNDDSFETKYWLKVGREMISQSVA